MPKTKVDDMVSEAPAVESQSDSPSVAPVLPTFAEIYAQLAAPFDKTFDRQIPGGRTLTYITGEQTVNRLTDVLGPNWDWTVDTVEIKEHDVVVTGTLTCHFLTSEAPYGSRVNRSGIGGAQIKLKRDGTILDLGNDVKAAETGALKRAAAKFGVGLYLYAKDEAEDELPQQRTYGQQGSYTPQAQRQSVQFAPDNLAAGSTTGPIEAVSMPRMGDDGRQKLGGLKVAGQWYNVSNRAPVDLGQFQRGQVVTIIHEPGKSFIDGVSVGGGNLEAEETLAF